MCYGYESQTRISRIFFLCCAVAHACKAFIFFLFCFLHPWESALINNSFCFSSLFVLSVHTVDLRTSSSLSLQIRLNVAFSYLLLSFFLRLHTRIYWNNFCVIYSSWLDVTVCALSLSLLILFVIKVKILFRSISFSGTFYIHFVFFFSLRAPPLFLIL